MDTLRISVLCASLFVIDSAAALAGEGWAKLTPADPSCPDASGNRYVDCGNGTVTDNTTGLVWLKRADCFGPMEWRNAMATISGISAPDCSLADNSSPGDWRLPSRDEWAEMTAAAIALGCVDSSLGGPSITNDAGTDCWGNGPSSFLSIRNSAYWSATSNGFVWEAWFISLDFSGGDTIAKTFSFYAWAVRGSQ